MSTNPPRAFIWYELMTTDTAAAASFYAQVTGWQAKDAGMGDRSYSILSVGETAIGGMLGLTSEMCDAGARPCWTGYIGVGDVDAEAARVVAAGGGILRAPENIPGVGRFAVVADPYGAAFVLFRGTSDQAPATLPAGTPGTIGWRELHAGDGAGAWEFYSQLFGWTKADAVDMGKLGVYQTFAAGGAPIGGMMTRMPETPGTFWQFYFCVDAVDAAVARATAAGAKLVMGPHQVPGGSWIATLVDPQGAIFAVVSMQR
jgi:uncharacterized protein